MHVVGIMGSPRRNSNTEILLDAALRGAEECGATTQTVRVCEMAIDPCREYYHCAVDGTCSINDDMRQVYEWLIAADRIVLASPVFFYGLTSQVKAMIDRCQALWVRRHVLKSWNPDVEARGGLIIAVGATHGPQLFDGVLLTASYFFDALGIRHFGQLLVRGVDSRAAIKDRPDLIEQARDEGRKLVEG
jgi:multimeric flavodoxin WrbA